MPAPDGIGSIFFSASDGLNLHALDAGPRTSARLPVICLPGLARTAEDFRELIEALAFDTGAPRRVLALDARGRGRSARDPNPEHYSVPVELGDVLTLLDHQKIARAVFVGTSRGGILTMIMGTVRPDAVAGAVLNDIGPAIEMTGLLRIRSYIGRLPQPRSVAEATSLLRRSMGTQFPAWNENKWESYARLTWEETENGLSLRYDPSLAETLASIDPDNPAPDLWPQFDALPAVPILVIRGEHSDILSRETVAALQARRPGVDAIEIAGEGHAPLLSGTLLSAIARFVQRCDA